MDEKTNVMRILDQKKIKHQTHSYVGTGAISGTEVAEALGQDPKCVFKTLVTIGKSKSNYVFVIPVEKELDLKKAAKVAGEKKVEMIHVKDITKYTGYIRGGCSPVGMKKLYKTFIYEEAENLEKVCVSGGKKGLQIKLSPMDLIEVVNGTFADIIH